MNKRIPKKRPGCLDGKTEDQKNDFFQSLCKFNTTDPELFAEQVKDLTSDETVEFMRWIRKKNENLIVIKTLLDVIEKIIKIDKENDCQLN